MDQSKPNISTIMNRFYQYRKMRIALLESLALGRKSNRDPLAEFSERLVAILINGSMADNPVQKNWDILAPNDDKMQVKYLANSQKKWVNEHPIHIKEQMTLYAIVIFESLMPNSVVIFPTDNMRAIGEELGKKHDNLDTTLQFTQRNYNQILNNLDRFKKLGVQIYVRQDTFNETVTKNPIWILK